jgi:Asp-tRNA(Asn)/Glu-tRNA(Gln) amidotransferase A subunit family amidase
VQRAHRGAARHVLEALAQRDRLLRLWELFLEERPLVMTPVSNEAPFPADLDLVDADTTRRIMRAQIMQLAVPVLGLPAVSVPTGLVDGVPMGVQVTAGRYREDLASTRLPPSRPTPRWRRRSIRCPARPRPSRRSRFASPRPAA